MQILYKVATLFPNPAVFNQANPNTAYTFAAGTYEYPFEFKVNGPFCAYVFGRLMRVR